MPDYGGEEAGLLLSTLIVGEAPVNRCCVVN